MLKSPKRSQSPKNRSRSPIDLTKEPKITIQDKRQQLKQQLRQKKMDKKRAMGLLPPDEVHQDMWCINLYTSECIHKLVAYVTQPCGA